MNHAAGNQRRGARASAGSGPRYAPTGSVPVTAGPHCRTYDTPNGEQTP